MVLFFFFFFFFGGLECVGHSFAYVAQLWFLRDVWIRTQSTAVASWRATDLATHPSKLSHPSLYLATHPSTWNGTVILTFFDPLLEFNVPETTGNLVFENLVQIELDVLPGIPGAEQLNGMVEHQLQEAVAQLRVPPQHLSQALGATTTVL